MMIVGGHGRGRAVVLARNRGAIFAYGAGAPITTAHAEGMLVADTSVAQWHKLLQFGTGLRGACAPRR